MNKTILKIMCGLITAGMLAGCAGFSGSAKKEIPVRVSLSEAVRKGDLNQVKSCLDQGADIAKTDRRGRTVLHLAVMVEKPEVARYLLEHGANVNSQDDEGRTPLHIASALKNNEISNLLREHGADRTIRDVYGRIPGDLTPVSREQKMARRKQRRQERKARSGKRKIRWKNSE